MSGMTALLRNKSLGEFVEKVRGQKVDSYLVEQIEQLRQDNGQRLTAQALAQVTGIHAVSHLIGPVGGRSILDIECGDGRLARWLAVHGAHVTGVDKSSQVIEGARERERHDANGVSYLVGDPEDLYMIDDSAFDDVVCNLSLARIEQLSSVIAEISRIIKLGGRFIFSVCHPCFELELFEASEDEEGAGDYLVEGLRETPSGAIRHRTLATYINAVAARGFTVRRVLEPTVEERDVADRLDFDAWRRTPIVLAVEAVFPHI